MTNDLASKKLVSIGEAAEIVGVSVDTLRRWDKKGIIHSKRPNGKDRYFLVSELERVKASQPLSIAEAAEFLGVSQSTLRRFEEKGFIKPQRNGNKERLYTKDILDRFIKSYEYLLHRGNVSSRNKIDYFYKPTAPSAEPKISEEEREQQEVEEFRQSEREIKNPTLNFLNKEFSIFDGLSPHFRDFVLYRLFIGLVLFGWGIVYLLRYGEFLSPGEISYLRSAGIFYYMLPFGLIVSGLLILATSIFKQRFGRYQKVADLIAIVNLGYLSFLTIQTRASDIYIVAAAIALSLISIQLRGYEKCSEKSSVLNEFIILSLFLVFLKGLSIFFFPSATYTNPIEAYIIQFRSYIVIGLLAVVGPFLISLLWHNKITSKLETLFLLGAGTFAFIFASFLSIESRWNLGFFSFIYCVFILFLIWWKNTKDTIAARSFYIVVLTFVWVAGVIIFSLFSLSLLQERAKQKILETMQGTLSATVSDIDFSFTQTKGAMAAVTTQNRIISLLKSNDKNGALSAASQLYDQLPNARRILILDTQGNPLAAYPRNETLETANYASRDYFKKTQASLRPYISPVFSSVLNVPVVVITKPLFDQNNLKGMIIVGFDLEKLTLKYQNSNSDSAVYAIDENGLFALNQNSGEQGKKADVRLLLGADTDRNVYISKDTLRVYDTAKNPRWTVFIEQPTTQLLAGLSGLYNIMGVFVIINSAFSLAAGFVLAKKLDV